MYERCKKFRAARKIELSVLLARAKQDEGMKGEDTSWMKGGKRQEVLRTKMEEGCSNSQWRTCSQQLQLWNAAEKLLLKYRRENNKERMKKPQVRDFLNAERKIQENGIETSEDTDDTRLKATKGEGNTRRGGTLRGEYTSFDDAFLFSKQTREHASACSLRRWVYFEDSRKYEHELPRE